MDIKNSFDVPVPVEEAWRLLLDIKKIALCMPGAELLEVVDPKTYKGKVSVRLGPVALSFVGTARFEEIDEVAHRARVKGQGSDAKGRGGASGVVTFALSPIDGGTKVDVDTNLNLSGSVAQYGRGTGMIQDVATQIIGQFAASLRAMIERDKAQSAAPAGLDAAVAKADLPPPPSAKPISGFSLVARVLWNALRQKMSGRDHRQTWEWLKRFREPAIVVTLLLFGATLALYVATRELVVGAEDTAKKQLRAYVFIDKASVVLDGRTFKTKVDLKNYGQTPAYDVLVKARLETRNVGDVFNPEPTTPKEQDRTIMGPGMTTNPRAELVVPSDNTSIIPALQSKEPKAVIYLVGQAEYRDTFDRIWILDFRMRSGPYEDGVWLMHPTEDGNNESQEKP
jgi:uncharacterized protein